MAGASHYWLKIEKLPFGISWQQLKDYVRLGDGRNINVIHVPEIPVGLRAAWLEFNDREQLQLAYDFLKKRGWKGSRLKVEKWNGGEAVSCGLYKWSYLAAPQRLQVHQANPGFPAIRYAPPPLLTNQWSEVVMESTPGCYSCFLPRSYPGTTSPTYATRTSDCGSNGSDSNYCAASMSNSIASGSTPPTPVYLAEPRGVHIGNIPLETYESEIRSLVTRTLQIRNEQILDVRLPTEPLGKQKGYALVSFHTRELAEFAKDALDAIAFRGNCLRVKTDQDWQTLYPLYPTIAPHSLTQNFYQEEHYKLQTDFPQARHWPSSNPMTTVTYDGGDSRGHSEQEVNANPDPEFIDPLVVDGSKNRDLPKSSTNEEGSTKEKAKKDRGAGSKGKHKKR